MEADGVNDRVRRADCLAAMEVRASWAPRGGGGASPGERQLPGGAPAAAPWLPRLLRTRAPPPFAAKPSMHSLLPPQRCSDLTRWWHSPTALVSLCPQRHLSALSDYGPDHMLVRKARQLYEEAKGGQGGSCGGGGGAKQ